MPRVRDLLNRFRPSGTPGAAGGAGVPVDRGVAAREELEPLFALLAVTAEECAQIVARAERDAEGRRLADTERARNIVARARDAVPTERAAAASQLAEQAATDAASTFAAAQREVLRLQARVDQQAPAFVERVVVAVGDLITDDHGPDGHRGGAA